jgi:hypothetical protein
MMSVAPASDAAATATDDLKGPAAGFGLAAAIAILFNALLAWEPLSGYMASLAGDFWRTPGVAPVVAFFVLGYLFTYHKFRINGFRLAVLLAAASIVAGGGLALWFALV